MTVPNVVIGQRIQEEKAQRAKELRRVMTPEERILWGGLRANRLGGFHFRRQQVIAGFIADFYCHTAGLIVEVDGPIHDEQTVSDAERDRVLTALGFRILRFTNDEVKDRLTEVLDRIREICRERT